MMMFGTVNVTIGNNRDDTCAGAAGEISCGGSAAITGRFIAHELGHTFAWTMVGRGFTNPYISMHDMMIYDAAGEWVSGKAIGKSWERGLRGYDPGSYGDYRIPSLYHGPFEWKDWNTLTQWDPSTKSQKYTGIGYNEEWADMFMNWSYNSFENSYAGSARYSWMTTTISGFLP